MIEFTATLGEIVEMKKGISYRSTELVDSEQDGIPLINLKSFKKSGGFNENGLKYFCGDYDNSNLLQPNDLIIANTDLTPNGDILGSPILLPKELHLKNVAFSVDTTRYRIIDRRVVPAYLYRLMQTPLVRIQFKRYLRGATVKRFAEKDAKKIKLSFPTIKEQQKIVKILDKAEEMTLESSKFMSVKDNLIRNLFVEIFGDPVLNSKGWNKVTVEEIATIVRGSSPRPKGDSRYYGEGVPRLMVADLTRDGMYVTPSIDSLTIEGAKKSRFMMKGDLVMAVSGRPGLPAILDADCCIHDGFAGFRNLSENYNTVYLYYYFKLYISQVNKRSVGAIFKNITTNDIRRIELFDVRLELQNKFAKIVANITSLNYNKLHNQLSNLVKSISKEMLT